MKKIITLTICLALICSSVVPSYAAIQDIQYFYGQNTSQKINAYTVMTNIRDSCAALMAYVMSFNNDFNNWIELDASGNTLLTYYSWGEVSNFIHDIKLDTVSSLQTPTGHSTKGLLEMIWTFVGSMEQTLNYTSQDVNSILSEAGLIDYYTQLNNTRLNNIDQDLDHYFMWKPWLTSYSEGRDWYQDYYLIDSDNGNWGDISTERDKYTTDTAKLDFVLRLLQALNFNQTKEYTQLYTDVDSQLSIWDSQGNTLSQSYWTPTSGFNGLYKYLAFTQRDVARLTHVYASDEEIAARDAARQNQTTVVNNFVDGNGVGSVSASDLGDMASVSGNLQSNFDTGASVSGVFAFFSNGSSTNWFSQATADALDTSSGSYTPDPGEGAVDFSFNPTRSNSSDTPLLDAYYEEIYNLLGIGDDNR